MKWLKIKKINEYNSYNILFLVKDLNQYAYECDEIDKEKIQQILNKYGVYFACEKAMKGTKVRGIFKVKGKQPAIYTTDNYAGKDSFFFELFHEIGHCKSDYNEGKNKVIIDGNEIKEKKADEFALRMMIKDDVWKELLSSNLDEKRIREISEINRIPISFIVGRLAKTKKISYASKLYRENYKK